MFQGGLEMKLIDRKWNPVLGKYENTWLADDESGITADFDTESAEGSVILVISTEATWMKNTSGKWQKSGTTEVIA
jgi:hypothetical protein